MSDGTWFGGQHGPEGDWKTLKGRMLEPHTAQPMSSTAHGDSRHQAEATVRVGWESYLVTTGMTRGGGTMAK